MKPMQNTAYEALLRARSFERYRPKGMCARYVSDALSNGVLDVGIASAADAWNQAQQKEYDRSPPAGAPVYWSVAGSKWGHIAISVGRRDNIPYVRSTDFPANERVGECTLAQMEDRWPGMVYLGWSRDLAGRAIAGLEKAQPKPPKPPTPNTAPSNGNTTSPPNITPKPEENNMANFTPADIEKLTGIGVHNRPIGRAVADAKGTPLTFGIAAERTYNYINEVRGDVNELLLAVAALTAKVDALTGTPLVQRKP